MEKLACELLLEEIKEIKSDVKLLLAWKNEISGKISGIIIAISLFFTTLGFFISLIFML